MITKTEWATGMALADRSVDDLIASVDRVEAEDISEDRNLMALFLTLMSQNPTAISMTLVAAVKRLRDAR